MPDTSTGDNRPQAPAADGWRRLRQGLTARPGRRQVALAALLALVGFAVVVQVRSYNTSTEFAGARRGDLVQLLDSLGAADQRARAQLRELERTRQALRTSSDQARAAARAARQQAIDLAILSGRAPATGPGVAVTIEDPQGAVGARTLLNAVEELRDAGAEAIQVNGVARVVASTYFADTEQGIEIDGATVEPPYQLVAIGDSDTLRAAVRFRGGLSDEVEALGGSVGTTTSEAVTVSAVAVPADPQYSQPAG